jgi:hypothetical protein
MKNFIYKHKVIFSVIFAFLFIAISVCGYFLYTYFSFKKQLTDEFDTVMKSNNALTIFYNGEQYYSNQTKYGSAHLWYGLQLPPRHFYFGDINKDGEKLNIKFTDNLNIDVYKYNDTQNIIVFNYKNHSTKYLVMQYGRFWEDIIKTKD